MSITVEGFEGMISGSLGITEPWYIKECKVDSKAQTMHIYVSVREETKFACPKCGGDTKRYGYEKKRKLLIDKQIVCLQAADSISYANDSGACGFIGK